MKSKNVRIRLYRMQDYDLYRMYYDPDFDLHGAFRAVVKAYANHEPPPVIRVDHLKQLQKGSPVRIPLSFTIRGDKEVEMLEAATKNWKNANNFCKALLRRSIVGLNAVYFDEEDEWKYPDVVYRGERAEFESKKKASGRKPSLSRDKTQPDKTNSLPQHNDEALENDISVIRKVRSEKNKAIQRNVLPDGMPDKNEIPQNDFDPFAAIGSLIIS